jgi:O-antigen/teichoic acid export membrane protein
MVVPAAILLLAVAGALVPPAWIVLAAAAQLAFCVSTALSGIFLGFNDVMAFNLVSLIPVAVTAVFAALLAIGGSHDVEPYLLVWVAGLATGLGWMLWRLLKLVPWNASADAWAGLGPFVRFAIPGSITMLATLVNTRVDSLVVALLRSHTELGVYSVAVQVAEGLYILNSAIGIAVYSRLGSTTTIQAQQLASRSMRHVTFIVMSGAFLILIVADVLVSILFGPQFRTAVTPLRVLVVGLSVSAPVGVLVAYFTNHLGRPKVSLSLTLVGATLNLILSIGLIPTFGITGAAIASSASYAFQGGLGLLLFRRITGSSIRMAVLITPRDFDDYRRFGATILSAMSRRS